MAGIILVTGSPGSGKSTVGRALAEQFSQSVHIKVDDIRESMVGGFDSPGKFTPESLRQFKLARNVAVYWAHSYAEAGIEVIIDDVCIPESFMEHYAALGKRSRVARVLLKPSRDVLIRRITERGGPYAEFFIRDGLPWLLELIEAMPKDGWVVVDSSELSVEATVKVILERLEPNSK